MADGAMLPDWAHRLIELRRARTWTEADLARELKKHRSRLPPVSSLTHMIRSDWESGKHRPGPRYRLLLSEVLEIDEAELFGSGPALQLFSEDDQDVDRRRLLQALAALGVASSPPGDALATIRGALAHTLGTDHSVDDWEEMAADYGYAFLTTPAADLLPELAADVVAIQQALHTARDGARRELCRPAGQMVMLMALMIGALGNRREARRWRQAARQVADASGDIDLRVWVRGYDAMQSLHEHRSPQVVLARANEAIVIAAGAGPRAAVLEAMAARAQGLALMDCDEEAEIQVTAMERLFETLPPASLQERMSPRAWPETGLRHTRAWVYANVGHPEAQQAHEAALALYPPQMLRQRTQIRLLEAMTLVRSGGIGDGLAHAQQALAGLPERQRTIGIRSGAHAVLLVVPESEHRAAAQFREFLALPEATR